MKYQKDQQVTLLDTEFKPAVNAVIKDYSAQREKYLIEYSLPPNNLTEEMWVPQERLLSQLIETPRP